MKTYPRYFVGRLWTELDAYLRFDSQHSCVWVKNDGKETPQPPGKGWDADKPVHTWNEVTREIAQSRLLPEARPLRWVENCKPDKPGIWAQLYNSGNIGVQLWFPCDINESVHAAKATRCYLGPIPEILPPKKKVVQRLWINYFEPNDISVQCAWFDEGGVIPEAWTRTDRTREVEQ